MCGRYFIGNHPDVEQIIRKLNRKALQASGCKMHGEVFPGDLVPVLASNRQAELSAFFMQWGYHLNGKLIFNARSETAGEKSLFRDGYLHHRCILPATCYFEWDAGKKKYAIEPEQGPLWLAGVYRMEDQPVFSVLTREPGTSTAMIHDRMPVILPTDAVASWIAPSADPGLILKQAVTKLKTQVVYTGPEQLSMGI